MNKTKVDMGDVGFRSEPEIIITPKCDCKICLGRGQLKRWYSKQQGTYTKEMFNNLKDQPCDCLINQYLKLNKSVEPTLKIQDNKLTFIL